MPTIDTPRPILPTASQWPESGEKMVISYLDEKGESNGGKYNLFGSIRVGTGIDSDNGADKLRWLQSQIIGVNAEFQSPFGRRLVTYSDHTASGRFLRFVEDWLEMDALPFYGNTHTIDSYVGLHTGRLVDEASRYIKSCMGAGTNDVLLFCGSGCTAAIKRLQEVMGVTVPSILRSRVVDCLAPSERWVVFTGPYEHHSNLLSWRQSLAQVVEIKLHEDSGLIDMDALVEALELPEFSGRPKLGSFSACSNVTGIYTDTRGIARVLHEHGAYACFDFACSGPYVKIDMKSGEMDGYDAVFLSPHKFIGGPGSPGILLMSDALYGLKGTPPSTSGGGTVQYVNGYDDKDTIYCKDIEEREDAGTPGIVQKIRAALAFRIKEYMGCSLIYEQENLLMQRAMQALSGNPNIQVLGNNACTERQPIISFLIYPESDTQRQKHLHCRFVTKLLNDVFGIQARGGCSCAGPYGHMLLGIKKACAVAIRSAIELGYEGLKPGWTRVSLSYYTPVEEMEFVVAAIKFIAKYGHRFLPLYHFDWRTGAWNFLSSSIKKLSPASASSENHEHIRNKYEDYMNTAEHIANTLSDCPKERTLPEYIDPQLVTFRI
ncbi:hypothetical protein AAC387_Pa01g3788 [Persea americana]